MPTGMPAEPMPPWPASKKMVPSVWIVEDPPAARIDPGAMMSIAPLEAVIWPTFKSYAVLCR